MIGLPTNFQHCAHIGCSDVSQTANTIPTTGILHRGQGNVNLFRYKTLKICAFFKLKNYLR